MVDVVIVIPCYNEGDRLPAERFLTFLRQHPRVQFLFVDDGSSDDTLAVLRQLEDLAGERVLIHESRCNQGKAEAVRLGCQIAFEIGARFIGYWDADLATPLDAICDFLDVLDEQSHIQLVCGARVQMLGRSIRRNRLRHYFGRAFATAASMMLRLPVYDTQCGAKLFRANRNMRLVFSEPFLTRWLIDVEILFRLLALERSQRDFSVAEAVYELPLRQWHDVKGSKVRPLDLPKALLALRAIRRRYLGRDAWPAAANPAAIVISQTLPLQPNRLLLVDGQDDRRRSLAG
jgi:glycosyltransferase involved in cell wall biosynthesis